MPPGNATSIAKLNHASSAGNNAVLFDHSWDSSPRAVPTPAAARLLVAHQAFAVGGLIARLPGDPPSAEASHLLKAAVLLSTGASLFETLMLNMVRMEGRASAPFEFDPRDDRPAWEANPPEAGERTLRGYLDLLTWQSRRILLFPDEGGDTVSRAVIMAGYRFAPATEVSTKETMVAYRDREASRGQEGWYPVGFLPERALWRDSVSLLQAADSTQPAQNLRWLRLIIEYTGSRAFGLAAFGPSSDRAKLFLWRREKFPLPVAYLSNEDLLGTLKQAIGAAEEAATSTGRGWTSLSASSSAASRRSGTRRAVRRRSTSGRTKSGGRQPTPSTRQLVPSKRPAAVTGRPRKHAHRSTSGSGARSRHCNPKSG